MTQATTANNTKRNAEINKPPTNGPPSSTDNLESEGGGSHKISPEDEITPEQAKAEGLPEQKHAGKVGYGPEYANQTRATIGDKVQGLKEEIKGKLKKDPELVNRGHERRTGELKKHEHEEADKQTFGTAPKEKSKTVNKPTQEENSQAENQSAPANRKNPPVDGNQATASKAGSTREPPPGPSQENNNTPNPYPQKDEGLSGGKSKEVDLHAREARLTSDPKGPQAQDGEVQRAAEN